MADSKLATNYNEIPYLSNFSISGGNVNPASSNINNGFTAISCNAQADLNQDIQGGLMFPKVIGDIKYDSNSEFNGSYGSNNFNGYSSKYEDNGIEIDYPSSTKDVYLSNINKAYSKNNYAELERQEENENQINYSNVNPQYEVNNDYNMDNSSYISDSGLQVKPSEYNMFGYERNYKGYNSSNFYANDPNLNYQMYNMSQFSTPDNTLEMSSLGSHNNVLETENSYKGLVPLANNVNQNGVLCNFNNNSYPDAVYDYDNLNNRNSISGVKYQRTDNRWIARWTTAEGKRACKSFSVNIYGYEQAKMLAIQARQKGVALSGRSFGNRERQHAMKSGVGIIGIRFDKTQARWVSSYYEGGKRKFRYFTVKDYGYEQAKRNAIIWKSCNDERLVKRFKDGYGYYGSPERFPPNLMYPANFRINGKEDYVPGEVPGSEVFPVNNDIKEYQDINSYNPCCNNTEYSNDTAYSTISGVTVNELYNKEPIANYLADSGAVNIESPNLKKDSIEYPVNYPESYSIRNVTFNDGNEFIQTQKIDPIQSSYRDYLGKNADWENNVIGSYLDRSNKMGFDFTANQNEDNHSFTNTTIGSDNGDSKSSNSVDFEDHLRSEQDPQDGGSIENDENSPVGSANVTYDRKKGRWVCTFIDSEGRKSSRFFQVSRYGYRKAKELALSSKLEMRND